MARLAEHPMIEAAQSTVLDDDYFDALVDSAAETTGRIPNAALVELLSAAKGVVQQR